MVTPPHTFDFRGRTVAYTSAGRGDPIVLLHNGGTSHAIWREVTPLLAPRHTVFAIDLPGHGASPAPRDGHGLDTYADMLAAFLEVLRLDRVALVGNCMGAAIALSFAMRRPRDVTALVLVNPLTEATFAAGGLGSLLALRRRLPALARPLAAAMRPLRLPGPIAARIVRFQLGERGRAIPAGRLAPVRGAVAAPGTMRSLVGVFEDLERYRALDRFQPPSGFPPICTVWGVDNRVLSADAGCRLLATLGGTRQEWLGDCGHLPMLEDPERVATIITEVLAEARSAPGGIDHAAVPR